MNPLELFHFLQAILRNEAEMIAAFLVGVALTIVGDVAYNVSPGSMPTLAGAGSGAGVVCAVCGRWRS